MTAAATVQEGPVKTSAVLEAQSKQANRGGGQEEEDEDDEALLVVPLQQAAATTTSLGLPPHEQQQQQRRRQAPANDVTNTTPLLETMSITPTRRNTAATAAAPSSFSSWWSTNSSSSSSSSLWKRHKKSLSRAPSTPCLARYLIPLLSLATHFIFYYGQTATMWRLHLSQQVNVWANATSLESRTTLDTLGLPHHNHIWVQKEKNVREFTYLYAIQELWKAAHMPGKVLPRTAAVLLVIFSGIWPHVKLLLLNFTFLLGTDQVRRTRMLHWLSTLGKWSLADVLVVCVMVGVLHLDWVVDPVATKTSLVNDLPYVLKLIYSLYSASDICSLAMKIDCHEHHHSWDKWSQCKACVGFVKTILEHPSKAKSTLKGFFDGMDVSGGGLVYLRVHGMSGIYVFCTAVIMSIVISLVVDVFDVRAQMARHASASSSADHDLALAVEEEEENDDDDDDDVVVDNSNNAEDNDGDSYEEFHTQFHYRQRLHSAGEVAYDGLLRQTEELQQARWRKYVVWGGCAVTSILVVCGVLALSIERRVHGAIPNTLETVLGIEWDHKYSLLSLVQVTGAAGGYDYLLMGTFGLFIVIGPLLRVFLCILASTCPCDDSSSARRMLLAGIEFVGAFCAWEVLVAAVGMVDLLMPSITSTVILNPSCAAISTDGSCLSVEFDLLDSFTFVLLGGLGLVVLANWGYGSRRTLIEAQGQQQQLADYDLIGRRPSDTRLLTA